MSYLDAWREGHKDGMQLCIDQINKHCNTDFENVSEVILFINNIQNEDQRIAKSNHKLARDIAIQNWVMSDSI